MRMDIQQAAKILKEIREAKAEKANLQGLPANLAKIQAGMIRKMNRLSDQLADEDLSLDQWERMMSEIIAEGTADAMRAGKGGGRMSDPESVLVGRLVSEQLAFLANFKIDINDTGWLERYRSRAQMYASSTTGAYSYGDVIKQAGKILPLPSMPTEGTICHTNCGCRWQVDVIDKDKNDYDGFWQLGKDDNCQTCVQRALDWAPVKIRGGVLL